MNYGFVIDTRSCIGCHACSTACKSENQVPLGVNRTWVKYTETGHFPDTRRAFQVTRCNHCANPPCVRICPVTAMYQRADGIVEFDSDVCIGCKGCLQACPYDAIYIDPESKTAAKCHYCGHRVTQGLEPACVVVCPTHSIIAGDLDDPKSEIARVVAKNATTVRKPEQGTAPKLFYINGTDVSLHPTALPREPAGMMWADVLDPHGHNKTPDYGDATLYEVKLRFDDDHASLDTLPRSDSGTAIRPPGEQGVPAGGPIQMSGNNAGHMVSVAYNVSHKVPWHWQVPAYLTTKAVGAGAFLVLAVALLFGVEASPLARVAIGAVGILATLATTGLLVSDLERPERFLRILTRPQWKSWLTRGAFVLIGFSAVSGLWWASELGSWLGLYTMPPISSMGLAVLTLPLAIGAAVYTAFLFAQCEGRDLWQSPLLPFHLLVQSVVGGAAAIAMTTLFVDAPALAEAARWTLFGGLALDLFVTLTGEFGVAHASEVAARAAHAISHGKYKKLFWGGAVGIGHVAPLLLLLAPVPAAAALAAVLAIVGLYAYEHAFVMAPQEIPNS
jgi:Fe-S-cluster-containing dehydrogenase component/formate-dependent nitrite reductase membrane component NrfD